MVKRRQPCIIDLGRVIQAEVTASEKTLRLEFGRQVCLPSLFTLWDTRGQGPAARISNSQDTFFRFGGLWWVFIAEQAFL